MYYYDPFVLPFTIGLTVLLVYLIVTYARWIRGFNAEEKRQIRRGMFSLQTLKAVREVFLESLVHHKIFRTGLFLGYMHMCFALGWFLLIVVGKTESMVYHTSLLNPPYFAIFFRFFHPAQETFPYSQVFAFLMDLILTLILSGVLLAWFKRMYSKAMGMKRTTKHRPFDRVILTMLWLIFPLRFLAESFTSGLRGGGSFLTHNAGNFFDLFLPIEDLAYPAWWAYSSALGIFFLLLPFSRYMHIPTEIVYIFLKNWGLKQGREFNSLSKFELYSCSRCGICLDQCQLGNVLGMKDTQPVYFLRNVRHHLDHSVQDDNCLMCGRCEVACPVDLRLNGLRLTQRTDRSIITKDTFAYIPAPRPASAASCSPAASAATAQGIPSLSLHEAPSLTEMLKQKTPAPKPVHQSRVAYFCGCMGKLTPTVTRAMLNIFEKAGQDYVWVDQAEGICCGRPLLLTGNQKAADVLISKNKAHLESCGAEILVTSCPICYKTFRENYGLNIRIMHHSEYIRELIREKALDPRPTEEKTVFHNPCELGRGCGVTEAPLEVLKAVSQWVATPYDGKKSLCCGGSLANTYISPEQRTKLSRNAMDTYLAYQPDVFVTACPLCKKTFSKQDSEVPVKDLAEIVAENC